eukprot:TRINITY_DN759_c0_g1_i1.p2 TRINITY_DN759_c0_g1~~TRINITY_DN759_c0_g1_i1.p2  ORF type:complete len:219 (-),score=-2.64 TRINITY_DN759_c0_g1_i1:108-764(-)
MNELLKYIRIIVVVYPSLADHLKGLQQLQQPNIQQSQIEIQENIIVPICSRLNYCSIQSSICKSDRKTILFKSFRDHFQNIVIIIAIIIIIQKRFQVAYFYSNYNLLLLLHSIKSRYYYKIGLYLYLVDFEVSTAKYSIVSNIVLLVRLQQQQAKLLEVVELITSQFETQKISNSCDLCIAQGNYRAQGYCFNKRRTHRMHLNKNQVIVKRLRVNRID